MATLRSVNNRLRKEIPGIELVRGKGYFYLIGTNEWGIDVVGRMYETGIYTYSLTPWSVDEVVDEVRKRVDIVA
jgi:hypothetical protein